MREERPGQRLRDREQPRRRERGGPEQEEACPNSGCRYVLSTVSKNRRRRARVKPPNALARPQPAVFPQPDRCASLPIPTNPLGYAMTTSMTAEPGTQRRASGPGRPARPADPAADHRRIRRSVRGRARHRPRRPPRSRRPDPPRRRRRSPERRLDGLAVHARGRGRRADRAPGELDGRLPQRVRHRDRRGPDGPRSRSRTRAGSIRGSSARPSAPPPSAARPWTSSRGATGWRRVAEMRRLTPLDRSAGRCACPWRARSR